MYMVLDHLYDYSLVINQLVYINFNISKVKKYREYEQYDTQARSLAGMALSL